MTFLLPTDVEISASAKEKISDEFWKAHDGTQIIVLFYAHKSTKKSRHGEVLSVKHDFFAWGAHLRSTVPEEAIWVFDEHRFSIQDGRWEQNEKLLLDVVDGHFHMTRR